jgi:surface antigen
MRAGTRARLVLVLGSAFAIASPAMSIQAHASTDRSNASHAHASARLHEGHKRLAGRHSTKTLTKTAKARYVSSGLQCVPFARAASGIALKGNAANWWEAAAGIYERGSRPEAGAVLNFRPTGHMRLGHVAVVANVLSAREIEIDHANWSRFGATKGNISRATRVIDVSPANDWTAVRVELGHTGQFGAVYPTYGFIYDRPDTGTMIANTLGTLHPTAERPALDADEVAEALPARTFATPSSFLPVDAPARHLR